MYLILAVLYPPAAVMLQGKPSQVVSNQFLALLLYFPRLWHAPSFVDQHKTRRRNETLVRLVTRYYTPDRWRRHARHGHPA